MKYCAITTSTSPILKQHQGALKEIDCILKKDYRSLNYPIFNYTKGIDLDSIIGNECKSVDLCIGLSNNEYLLVEFKLDVTAKAPRRYGSDLDKKFKCSRKFLDYWSITINKYNIIVWNDNIKQQITSEHRERRLANDPYVPHTLESFQCKYF